MIEKLSKHKFEGEQPSLQIHDISIETLKEYEKNPRHNDKAVDAVAESIKQFGFKVPIIIDNENVIVAGHTRLKAALKLGLETVPCIIADDLTPEQVKAFRLADNKTGELAEWDFEKLEAELSELSDMELDFDISDFGFHESKFTFDNEDEIDDEIPENIELPRDEQGLSNKIPSISFGSKKIPMTEDEKDRFQDFYDNYLEENGSTFGMILELLENGSKNYEN